MHNKILFLYIILGTFQCFAQEAKDYEVSLCVNGSYTESTLHDGDLVTLSIAGGIPSQTKIESVQWYAVARNPKGERIYKKVSTDEVFQFKMSPFVFGWRYADGPEVRSGIVEGSGPTALPEDAYFYCDILYTYKGHEKTFSASSRQICVDVLPKLSATQVLEIYESPKEYEDMDDELMDARIRVTAANFKQAVVGSLSPYGSFYADTIIVREHAGEEETFEIIARWLENDSQIYCTLHNSYGYVTNEKVKITRPDGIKPSLSDHTLRPVAGGFEFESASPADIRVYRSNGSLCRSFNGCRSLSESLERGTYIISIRKDKHHTITRKIIVL